MFGGGRMRFIGGFYGEKSRLGLTVGMGTGDEFL